jgi:hypothetical protein
MTGLGAGYCGGYEMPGYANAGPRMGLAWRRGRGGGLGGAWGGGRGWRHQYYATGSPGWVRAGYGPAWGVPPAWVPAPAAGPQDEVEFLRNQAEWLQQELEAIGRRIDELEGED